MPELLRNVREGKFPRPREVNPAAPAALEAVCLKAMAQLPQDRYASAQQLAADIETTFPEMRSQLGLETTRGWRQETVLRMAPCLFRLDTLVVLFYEPMPWSNPHVRMTRWLGKETVTFSDMLCSARRYLWLEWVLAHVPGGTGVQKLPGPMRTILDFGLARAA
jgi:hypothetical protein